MKTETKQIDNGGPAFPVTIKGASELPGFLTTETHLGLSIRDYFAAKALSVALEFINCDEMQDISKLAYKIADAMLAARTEPRRD